jgi:hypothetical protein
MDCVKACPHDNIGLFAVAPAPKSTGPFSSRIDIAVLILVVVLSGFASAGWMVAPLSDSPRKYGMLLVVLAVLLLVGLAARGPSKREGFCRFSQALLPLGLAMWAAHLLFHLFTGWATLGPAIRQAGTDFGWHLLLPARWGMEMPLLSANTMLSVQLLLLDAGLLLTLYLGWRLVQQWSARTSRAVLLLLPWAATVAVVYAAGVWILLQPMQMRGVIMNP